MSFSIGLDLNYQGKKLMGQSVYKPKLNFNGESM